MKWFVKFGFEFGYGFMLPLELVVCVYVYVAVYCLVKGWRRFVEEVNVFTLVDRAGGFVEGPRNVCGSSYFV